MITLYGVTTSRTFRPLWMLEELGVPYEQVPVDYKNGGTRTAEHLELNPNGHIPVLVDDGLTLWESLAINLYLADKYGAESGLWPQTAEGRGLAYQWSLWVMTEVERWALQILHHGITLPEEQRDPAALQEAVSALERPFGALEGALDGRDYLLGDTFTVADLNVAAVIAWCKLGRMSLGPWPKLQAWLERCLERPARRTAGRRRP